MPVTILLLSLAACGDDDGGGGGGTPTSYCAPTTDWDSADVAFEDEVLSIANQRRSEGATCGGEVMPAVGPLTAESRLRCAARRHSLDMIERDFFDHTNPDGELPWDRMAKAGYADFSSAGENIAGGYPTPAAVMEGWMNSPGHCTNIMNGTFTQLGVGYTMGMWTQVFATP